jgi:preprotein translocase subunit SecF
MRKIKRETIESIVNTSINETLSRTILTTGTALMVLLSLFFLGGAVIRPFAFALLVGFFSGVYSTIFIASPVILFWEKRQVRRR